MSPHFNTGSGTRRFNAATGKDHVMILLQMWRTVANILNKQLRTADKGCPTASCLDVEVTSS